MSWTANDYRHYYVILERKVQVSSSSSLKREGKTSACGDNNDNNDTSTKNGDKENDKKDDRDNPPPSSPVNNANNANDTNDNNEWSNITANEWDTTTNEWDKPTSPRPNSPINPNDNKDPNIWDWSNKPSGSSSTFTSTSTSGPKPKPKPKPAQHFTVRDWARSPSPTGNAGGGETSGGSVWGDTTPSSSW